MGFSNRATPYIKAAGEQEEHFKNLKYIVECLGFENAKLTENCKELQMQLDKFKLKDQQQATKNTQTDITATAHDGKGGKLRDGASLGGRRDGGARMN